MKSLSNVVVAGFVWVYQAFCMGQGFDGPLSFINSLPKDRQTDYRITQSYSQACVLPGHEGHFLSGQLATVWFRVTQKELDNCTFGICGDNSK